jgi:hypothetical protein
MRRVKRSGWPMVPIVFLGVLTIGIGRYAMARRSPSPSYPPSSQYESRLIEGWTVLVNQGFLRRQPSLSERN